jgi:hypothetical protein
LVPALVLVACVVALVAGALDGPDRVDVVLLGTVLLLGAGVVLAYLRPAVLVHGEDLVLRTPLGSTSIPLAAVERVTVSRFLAVFAGEQRFVSTTVSRPLRGLVRGTARPAVPGEVPWSSLTEADLVEQRLAQLAEDARARAGVALLSDEQAALAAQVRRRWSWPSVAALVVPSVVLVVGAALL